MMPLKPPTPRVWLFGENSSDAISPWPIRTLLTASLASRSQTRTRPSSSLEETSCLPSGLSAIAMICSRWPSSVAISAPVAGFHRRIVPSTLPDASVLPSCEKASPRITTQSVCPVSSRFTSPLAGSSRRTTPSIAPTASCLPSGEKATPVTQTRVAPSCISGALNEKPLRCRPVATSHSRTLPSREPEASDVLSGEKATPPSRSVCPLSVCSERPVATSQIRMVRSMLPEASSLPSGEKARLRVQPVWPVSVRICWPVDGFQR